MKIKSFSLKIGSLIFGFESISYILFGFFLIGIIVAAFSIINIKGLTIFESYSTLLIIMGLAIPFVFIYKGIQKAEDISNQ
ncbi:MAG: hypothetical protein EA390_03425 [Balneolaceae bacterium]|nr:MAG: hypothetical protein EA390_03425 [Balneolaceae bacterium]